MKKFIAILSVLCVSLFVGISFGAITDINPLIIGTGSFIASFIPLPTGCSAYMLLYTSPAVAAQYQFNLTFLPEWFTWNDAAAPITLFRVETQEHGVLHDYNAAAIAAANGYMKVGAQAANQVQLKIADGHIEGVNTTITLTTAAAAAIAFFGSSDNRGIVPFKFSNAQILALNPTSFRNFTAIFAPTMAAATDRVTVTFKDGHKQIFAVADLIAMSSMYQQLQGIIVNNVLSYIDSAIFETVAATPAYILSVFKPV